LEALESYSVAPIRSLELLSLVPVPYSTLQRLYSRGKNSGPFMMLGKPLFFLDAHDFKNHKYHNYFTITV